MRLARRIGWWGVIVALLIALLVGTGSAAAQRLIVAQASDAVTLDPHRTADMRSIRVQRQIYETLVEQGPDLRLYPGLAESWEAIDERTWEFRLRKGVVFHNGEPFSARDVKYSFDRLTDPATGAPGAFLLEMVEAVEVVDDFTVRIRTKAPFAPILNHLAHAGTAIVNEKAIREAGDGYGTRAAVGTGPFRFESWVRGSHITLRRNPDWWRGEKIGAEELVFRAIPEDTVRAIEVETGGVDIAFALDPIDRVRLESDPNVKLSVVETLYVDFIGFNTRKPPFDDVRVRQAINHAINVDDIVDVLYDGQATRAFGPLPPGVFGAHTDLKPYEYDPEQARRLLAEAGYPNGFHTTLWTNEAPLRMQIAEVVQEYLRAVGIGVDIQVLEWGSYLQETAAGHHDMFILGWSNLTGDADYSLYPLFHSSQWGAAGNRTFYANPRVDELLEKGRASADPEERLTVYREAQELIRDDAPWVFLLFRQEITGLRANVEGFTPSPTGDPRLQYVSKR